MSHTKRIDDHAEYHQALGVFVEMYAAAERATYVLLVTCAQLGAPIARSIWPSIRVRDATSIIRRLYESQAIELPAQLDEALSQLVAITSVRDDILHYGTAPDSKGRLVDTAMYAYSEERLTKFRVSTPLLNALSNDLQIVICRFVAATARPTAPEHQPQYDAAVRRAHEPFLYIPPSPEPKRRKTQTGAQLPKRQRKASRKLVLAEMAKGKQDR